MGVFSHDLGDPRFSFSEPIQVKISQSQRKLNRGSIFPLEDSRVFLFKNVFQREEEIFHLLERSGKKGGPGQGEKSRTFQIPSKFFERKRLPKEKSFDSMAEEKRDLRRGL